jgi:hypothetical protein
MEKLHRLIEVKVIEDYKIYIKFNDGFSGILDLYPLLSFEQEVFQLLKKLEYFNLVGINECGVICWPNEADIDTETLYDWLLEFGENLKFEKIKKLRISAAPIVCKFQGINIEIRYNEGKHNLAHFHATYGGKSISIAIGTWEILDGTMPSVLLKYIIQWAKLHKDELQEGWDLCKQGKMPKKIPPPLK